jgi:hypothetical protein
MEVIIEKKPNLQGMSLPELYAYIHELENKNAQLEEQYPKSLGVIAADTLPTPAEMYKVSEMCKKTKCKKCLYFNAEEGHCRFEYGADCWTFGGAE